LSFLTPLTNSSFSVLQDVTLVHQGHTLALILDSITDRTVDQSHTSGVTHRLDSNTYSDVGWEIFRADRGPELFRFAFGSAPNLLEHFAKIFLQKIHDFLRFGCARRPFDSGINVFRVLAKDHHVHLLGMTNRRGDAFEPLHRT